MLNNFSVNRRNPGHWDIWDENGRIFRLRGGPSKYLVSDERNDKDHSWKEFRTLAVAMSYICDELMFESIVVEGQEHEVIKSYYV